MTDNRTICIVPYLSDRSKWQLEAVSDTEHFTEEGPFDTVEQAKASIDDYAEGCGWQPGTFDVTVDE